MPAVQLAAQHWRGQRACRAALSLAQSETACGTHRGGVAAGWRRGGGGAAAGWRWGGGAEGCGGL